MPNPIECPRANADASDGLWGTLLCRKGSSVAADAPLRGRGSGGAGDLRAGTGLYGILSTFCSV